MARPTNAEIAAREAAKAADDVSVTETVKAPVVSGQMSVKQHIEAVIHAADVIEVEGGLKVIQDGKQAIVSDKIPLPHIDAGLRNAGFVFK